MSDGELTTDALPSPPRVKKEYNNLKKENPSQKNVDEGDVKFQDGFDDAPPKQKQSTKRKADICVTNMNYVNCTNIQVGDINNYGRSIEDRIFRPPIIETELIRSLKKCNKAVTREDIGFVSEHMMVTGWKNTARALNYSDGQIQQYTHMHPLDIREAIYQLLLDWIQNKPEVATVSFLSETLWCMKQKEVVQLWSEQYEKIHSK